MRHMSIMMGLMGKGVARSIGTDAETDLQQASLNFDIVER